jgi:hypothetical protein
VFCYEGEIITHVHEKHYPPDPTAMIFWLKNRQPERWRDQPREEGAGGKSITLTVEDARKILSEDFASKPDEKVEIPDL